MMHLHQALLLLCWFRCTTTALALNVIRQDNGTSGPTATLDSGVVIGVQTSVANSPNIVNKFLGVPFAASPTRFALAETARPWEQPYMATQNGPACIQQFNYPEAVRNIEIAIFNTPPAPESEDCLNLNVFAPAAATDGKPKAVMVWIFGGVLQFGWNGVPTYDGSSLAANQDVILVAINYRTNVFGFPSSPSLPVTARNLGYLDQRFALAWIQRNIHAFGGDPDRVTIFGQSAGSASVDSLITSFGPEAPDGPAPFHGAIMESGSSSAAARPFADPTSWPKLIEQLNCTTDDDIACARAASVETIKSIIEHGAINFRPTKDNYTQLEYGDAARRSGQVARVPVMTGTNANEGIEFTYSLNDTDVFLQSQIPNITDVIKQRIISAYPIGERGISTETAQIAAMYGELFYQCPSAIVANDSASAGIPAWRYLYNATFPNVQPSPGRDYHFGVFHGSEIPFVFGTYNLYQDPVFGGPTEEEARLSELMQNMWATFAKNPNGGPAAGWEEAGTGFVEVLGGPGGSNAQGMLRSGSDTEIVDGDRCEIWRPFYNL